ncbi:hypothetical protein DRQ18_06350, partial [bacterium]
MKLKRSEPLQKPDEDRLFGEFYTFAKEIILSIKPPFVMGLSGAWGRGKTTFFNFLQNDEEITNKYCVIFLDAMN